MSECGTRLSNCNRDVNVPIASVIVDDREHNANQPHGLATVNQAQCPSNVLNDLVLSRFYDCHKQNVVHFIRARRLFSSKERAGYSETASCDESSY
jgi:hypothetical protein